jgi:hypothetical protein
VNGGHIWQPIPSSEILSHHWHLKSTETQTSSFDGLKLGGHAAHESPILTSLSPHATLTTTSGVSGFSITDSTTYATGADFGSSLASGSGVGSSQIIRSHVGSFSQFLPIGSPLCPSGHSAQLPSIVRIWLLSHVSGPHLVCSS